jgi:hypothetical protein
MQWMLMLFFFFMIRWGLACAYDQTERRRAVRELRFETWRGRQDPAGNLGRAQRAAVDRGVGSRVTRASRSPTSSFQHANHGRLTHTHTHGSHVVSNNLPLIIRACALLLWFALHAWLETCRQSLSYSLSLPLTSPFSLAQQNVCWLCSLNVIRHGTRNWQPSLNASPSSVYLNTTATNAAKWVSSRCELYSRASNAIFVQNINAKRSIVAVVLNLSPPFSGLFARGIYFYFFFFFLFVRSGRGIGLGRFPVGQNLAVEWTTGPPLPINWKTQVTRWYEEVQEFPNTSARKFE